MGKYTRFEITDNGADILILAPQCNLEDIIINATGSKLSVSIPDNPFTGQVNYVENFSNLLNVGEAKASLKDGVLKIEIPYDEEKKPKRINIM